MVHLVRIPYLGPPRPIDPTEKLAGVDAKLISDVFSNETMTRAAFSLEIETEANLTS
jgi:hypothetical protein